MPKDNNKNVSGNEMINPFHQGEIYFQEKIGVCEEVGFMAKRAITSFMPMQHQDFFSKLPMILVGAEDKDNNLWASVLIGEPGFIQINDIHHFTINDNFLAIDPLAKNLKNGNEIGFLGIQFENRRRNRVSAKVHKISESKIQFKVKQCFGNCPKYIQKRQGKLIESVANPESISFNLFDKEMTQFIHEIDSMFIASQHVSDKNNIDDITQGVDVSHRGGMPGFIQVENDHTLLIPDYMGNNFFNTMGNISLNPKVGIQFLDYKNGHRIMLTGTAEIIWAEEEELPFLGVDRMTRFSLKHGFLLKNSFPFEWNFKSYSPFSEAYQPE